MTKLESVKLSGKMLRSRVQFLAAFILVSVFALQFWGIFRKESSLGFTGSLASKLPLKLGLTIGRDESIAASEEMKRAVQELLNYDDAVYRIYSMPRQRISVYVAWWAPGKMSPRLVAAHTPDVCWPSNGWVRDIDAERQPEGIRRALGKHDLNGVEYRVFRASGRPEYILFWHRFGSKTLSYSEGGAPPWWAFMSEIWENGLDLKQEQLFIRVSSDTPINNWLNDEDVRPLFDAFRSMGFAGKTP